MAFFLTPFQSPAVRRSGSCEMHIVAVHPRTVLSRELAQSLEHSPDRDGVSRGLGIKLPVFFCLL